MSSPPEDYARLTQKTAADLKTIMAARSVSALSHLTLPEIDRLTEQIAQVIPAGNIPGLILNDLTRLEGRQVAPGEQQRHPVVILPTPVPPTLSPTPEPPTIIPTAPPVVVLPTPVPQTAVPTILYPDGLLFILIWDDGVFYVANQSGQRVASSNMAFERLLSSGGTGEHYKGKRWSAFYPWSESRRCLVLRQPRARFLIPRAECPDGYNSDVQTQSGEAFWTAAGNSTKFRVLWKGAEVGRCKIAARRCEVRFPRS